MERWKSVRLCNEFSAVIIVGFIIGLIKAIYYSMSNGYHIYHMVYSIGLSTVKFLNRSVLSFLIVAILFTAILLLLYLIGLKWISKVITIQLRKGSILFAIVISLICLYCLIWTGWLVNHYILPDRLHPISLVIDFILVVFWLFFDWILIKKGHQIISSNVLRNCAVSLIVILLLANCTLKILEKINKKPGPNIILIIVDTFRADHLDCYGYSRQTAPNLNDLARNNLLFTNAISQAPWTTPSIGSIITSKYPSELGFLYAAPVVIKNRNLTLAEILKEKLYKTRGIISHDFLSHSLGFSQGFDEYDEENVRGHGHISSPSITAKAVETINKFKNDKFFLFLHYFDPHFDFILHKEYNYKPDYQGPIRSGQTITLLRNNAPHLQKDDIEYIQSLYDSEISFTDQYIGLVLDELSKLQIDDNTMVIVTGDHGEEFCERGDHWIGHTKTLYQELIHVPLIIKLPGKSKQRVIKENFSLINLMASIIHSAGLQIPTNYQHSGRIIDFEKNLDLKESIVVSETNRWARLTSVIYQKFKLIFQNDLKRGQLYNLEKDPGERRDLSGSNQSVYETLEMLLKAWKNQIFNKESQIQIQEPSFSDEEKKRLKSLGYL